MFSCKATQRSTQALGAAQGHVPPKGSLALILPSRTGPLSDYKVAVNASVRRRSGRMPLYPLALILADSRALCFTGMCLMVVLRLHLPEEELDGVLHEAGDGHRTYAARNWGNY